MRGRFRVSKDGVSGRGRRRDLSWLTVLAADDSAFSLAQELELRGVSKSFPGRGEPVLAGVDLTLRRSGSLAVGGRSESGLTTLAAAVAGTVAYKGDVLVDGRPRGSGEVAFMPGGSDEELESCAGLRVWEFLVRRHTAAGASSRTAKRCAEGAVHDFELGSIANVEVGRLGHVERFRLLVARALMGAPPFLVVDEPDRGLAGEAAITVVNYLLDMTALVRCGVVYTTKRAGQAGAADQWFELRHGTLYDMLRAPTRLRVVS